MALLLRLLLLLYIFPWTTQEVNKISTNNRLLKKREPRQLRDFCSGTYNERTMAGSSDRFDDLKMYENCTRIHGNLEITHLTAKSLNWTSEEMKRRITIFDHIEEVKGYVLIYNVDLQKLSFKNLRMIWGDDLLEEGKESSALTISGNHNLKEIYMPNLRSIHKGSVRIENNTFLCHLRSKVNWDELLELDAATRLIRSPTAHKQCDFSDGSAIERCHENCTSGYCWGSKPEMCQELYRTICPRQCSSRQCYYNETQKEYDCCHETCAGGCTGISSTDCLHCRTLSLNGSCVSSCPHRMVTDPRRGMLVPNPEGTFQYDRYCVKECPKQLLMEGDTCVRHCSVGSHHDMTKDTRQCERCQGACPKVCQINSPLTGTMLKSLKNCEEIDGYIEIQDSRMKGPDGFTAADLEVFRSVRMISEYVSMATQTHSPHSLSFLENLEFIEGRSLSTQRHALVVTKNDNLRSLGLRKLHTIKAGNVIIVENHSLCYASTVNWTRILQGVGTTAKVETNMLSHKCAQRGLECHDQCDPTAGCWGKGPSMCVQCLNWNNNGTCVETCPEERFYQDEASHQCLPCYDQCLTCDGSEPSDCTSCRSVSLLKSKKRDPLTCLEQCPLTHYEDNRQCMPCHDTCIKHGCTGPLDIIGEGGCNKCEYALLTKDLQIERCLTTKGPQGQICAANNLSRYHTSTFQVNGSELLNCELCDDECVSCTSGGKSVQANGCKCKTFEVEGDNRESYCLPECSMNTYVVEERTESTPGICKMCSPLCDKNQGCSGPAASECKRCAVAGIFVDELMVCVDQCPTDVPYQSRHDKVCHSEDVDGQAKKRQIVVILAIVGTFIMLVVMVAVIYLKCRRIKMKLEKAEVENFGDFPMMKPIDPLVTVKPNFNKMTLLTMAELQTKPTKLGAGAFGIVYAGYWYPKGKDKLKVPVAIKLVKAVGKVRGKEEAEMLEEATKMAMMKHEHLLRLVGVCLHEDGIQLVTLLRPLGDLLNFMKKHKSSLNGKDLLLYCYQISSAMKYLYNQRLVHRDLAARNVLVKRPNHIEVTDFGLSKMLSYGETDVKVEEGKVAFKWLALESLKDRNYNHSTDVWAFGVTCWEVLTCGESPYAGMQMQAIRDFLREGNRLPQPNNCSSELYHVLVQCWMANPDSRPTFVVLKDRFLEFCRVPHLYVGDNNTVSTVDLNPDQLELIREIMADGVDDVANPLNYFDNMNSVDPQSPGFDTQFSFSQQCQPRQVRRHTSTGSQRYQTDPMTRPLASRPSELGMDDGNYLVPKTRESVDPQAVFYTPVADNELGTTELVTSDYYNEAKKAGGDYYNDVTNKNADLLNRITEESEEMEKESCL